MLSFKQSMKKNKKERGEGEAEQLAVEAKGKGSARWKPPAAGGPGGSTAPTPRRAHETHSTRRAGRALAGGLDGAVVSGEELAKSQGSPTSSSQCWRSSLHWGGSRPHIGSSCCIFTGPGGEGSEFVQDVKEGLRQKAGFGTTDPSSPSTSQKGGSPVPGHSRKMAYRHPRKGLCPPRGNHPENVPEGQEAQGCCQKSHNSRPWSLK